MGELPRYMMPLLTQFDPSRPQTAHGSEHDLFCHGDGHQASKDAGGQSTGLSCSILQELHRCAELCNILSILVADGPEVKRSPLPGTDWVSIQVRANHQSAYSSNCSMAVFYQVNGYMTCHAGSMWTPPLRSSWCFGDSYEPSAQGSLKDRPTPIDLGVTGFPSHNSWTCAVDAE